MIRNIIQLFEILSILYCLANLFEEKLKYDIYVVVLIIIDLFLFKGINEYGFSNYFIILIYIMIFVYCLLSYKKRLKDTLVNFIITFFSIGIMQLVLRAPIYFIWGEKIEQNLIDELTINLCILVIFYINRKRNMFESLKNILRNKRNIFRIVFCSLLVLFIVEIIQMKNNMSLDNNITMLFVYFVIILWFVLFEWEKVRIEAEKKKIQLEMNSLYSGAFEELITVIRERQHDIKSHIDAILGMIHTVKTYDELVYMQKEYCKDIIENSKESKILLCIENPLIAGFLYKKVQEIRLNNIEIEYELALQKEHVKIPEYDFIEMLGILIDNAIEEARRNSKGKIKIAIFERGKAINIIVANTSELMDIEEISRMFKNNYSKKEGVGRGIGLPKLKRIVEEKNGEIEISNYDVQDMNFLQFHVIIKI